MAPTNRGNQQEKHVKPKLSRPLKRKHVKYTQEQKDLAMESIRNGLTYRATAKLIGARLSISTITYWRREAARKERIALVLASRGIPAAPAAPVARRRDDDDDDDEDEE